MQSKFHLFITTIYFIFSYNINLAQAPDLGAASSFTLFTAAGAFNNVGATVVIGDIGTNVGAFTGFPPGIVVGQIHVADAISAQAAADVDIAYSFLDGINCGLVLGTTMGGGQILTPNVYCLGAASVINGNLTLDAEGDPNALFIFQIDGALSTSTFSNVFLVNGASVCNVYWQVNGAFDLGDNSVFTGTLIAAGALSLNTGAVLNGRALSTAGAISTSANFVSLSPCCFSELPTITCPATATVSCTSTVPAPDITSVNVTGSAPLTVVFISDVISGQTCDNRYTITRTYQVSDACSNTATCNQTITVNDQTPPGISTCPGNLQVSCANEVPAADLTGVIATDDCGGVVTISTLPDAITGLTCANRYSITRTYVATDACGNSASCNQTITVNDQTPPTATCPAPATVSCASLVPVANPADVVTSDACGGVVAVTVLGDAITGLTCPNRYTITRTYQATDLCGNSTVCNQTIIVNDQTPPTATCPAPTTVSCASLVPAANPADVIVSDACGGIIPVIALADVISGQICPNQYTITRTYQATDLCGNIGFCNQIITVSDLAAPVILCPTLALTVECPAIPVFPDATASDLCDGGQAMVTFQDVSVPSGFCPQEYSVTRTWTASDACGNSAQCSRTVSVTDNTAPSIICPTALSPIECQVTPNFPQATATDLCDGNPAITFNDINTPGACAQAYSVTRTWTATDACGNSSTCNQTINVSDQTPPIITCPVVVSPIECPLMPTSFDPATATDLCDVSPVITFSDITTPGACAQSFTVTRTWTATDACGNSAACQRSITMSDNTAPVITCPTVISPVECPTLPALFPPATVIDACDVSPIVVFVDVTTPSGLCAQEYSVTRTWTATDACGNSASCQRSITVTDNTAPAITCMPDAIVSCLGDVPIPAPEALITNDLCGGAVTAIWVNDLVTNQTCPNRFTISRTYQATDPCGNSAFCVQTILVNDQTPPAITCPPNTAVQCAGDLPIPTPNTLLTTDLCGGPSNVIFLSDAISNEVCDNRFTVTRTYRSTDACGNFADCAQIINVFDNIPPTFPNPPANLTAECIIIPPAVTPLAIDNCSGIVTVVLVSEIQIPGICPVLYTLTRTWSATDNCGNSATIAQVVTLRDTYAPQFTSDATDVSLECNSSANAGAFQDWLIIRGGGEASDCSAITWTYENSPFPLDTSGCAGTFQRYIRFIATDVCGNSSFQDARFIISDQTPPVFVVLPLNMQIENPLDCNGDAELSEWVEKLGFAQVSDNCGAATLEMILLSEKLDCGNTFTRIYQFRATDDCGNTNYRTATFSVVDTTPPVIDRCPPDSIFLRCEFDVPGPNPAGVVAHDNCGTVTATLESVDSVGVGCLYWPMSKLYTYAVKDACGNISRCYQSFQVVDSIPPHYSGPDTLFVICLEDLPGLGEAMDMVAPYMVDNCYDIICLADSVLQTSPNSILYKVKAKDLCANWICEFFVTFAATGECQPICSAPQATWGDPQGTINNMTTTNALDKLFVQHGGVTTGKLGKTIIVTSTDCIHQMLPGDGNTDQFNPGNALFGIYNNCQPNSPLLNNDGTMKNSLSANTMALQFNIWYNQRFNNRNLGVQKLANLPACLIDPMVRAKVDSEFPTVQGVLNLSNDYLGGLGAFPPGFGDAMNTTLEQLNNYWLNCQLNDPCPLLAPDSTQVAGKLTHLNLSPNPVQDMATIDFEIGADATLHLRFIGSDGVQSETFIPVVKGNNTFSFSTKSFPAGVFTIVIQHDTTQQTLRMVKVMD